jgi:DNA polymerase bacteriophage-type
MPRQPTKRDPRVWIRPADDPADAERLYEYCDDDVATEKEASGRMPPMSPMEREFWLIDQEINWRGLGIDRAGVRACIIILNQAIDRYGEEMRAITGGLAPSQVQALVGWLSARGVYTASLDADHIEALLKRTDLAPAVRRVLEIRELVGSASVKKLFAMENMASRDDRLRNLMVHHGARTGRPTGEGAQPLNMPKAGPKLATCGCGKPYHPKHDACPWCGAPAIVGARTAWKPEMADHVLHVMAVGSLDLVEWFFGDAVLSISGCLRALFVAGPGCDLVASDYSAIEAVVIAMLAKEQWRIDAFNAKTDIYLASIARVTGVTLETYLAYERDHGQHHPDRATGKILELALGFGGWINAIRAMETQTGIDLKMTDDEVKPLITAWRDASPAIVELWGGQWRGKPWDGYAERYGFEGAAVNAVQYPGREFWHAGIKFQVETLASGLPALIVTLLSGRRLTYHEPVLSPSTREYASPGELSLSYMTWNSNPKYGPLGWVRMSTYGSRLAENIVQAIAHDILRYAIVNLRRAGFNVVLHVYDEIVAEIPSWWPADALERFEAIMSTMAAWAFGWPVRAAGGWRGRRFRKG